ncbi:Acetyltransferase [Pseudonocardia sp. Ae406_Ps2]|uniref:GNAT family N-acetyltransferase n=1 Tax=unclassified Pseudonocardia TaxID=2619320 RepID=UPI00094B62FA|nr:MULTISPECIES: GNAT family N-acetyltransferase [unclassified Pseudonocardia]OLM00336.1 Acetyltransferase [Pseudonocardia sp. Ae406_Ps2]OLM07873.1 Acetyltransferase [Pseudonocardia sp. Ae331_Ps2]OLM13877.1 Acetyltransferase [Pseudonocardia sp. Ae505_Ps2]OLM21905.1 Acetyltransferase [Pseudonocardia sp. Ae706_Ps2]OLM30994.1 Acetyltransferase [Pseudonocardia sp. Ae717_Ps2]
MQLRVWRFGPDDWEQARVARLASVRDGFGEDSDFYREQAALEPAAWRVVLTEHVRFAAFDGDRPVGTACWRAGDDGDGLLYGMWVHPDLRGTGVADALVDAVTAVARENGSRTLSLKVEPDNARAIAFYLRTGFVADGVPGPGLTVMSRPV